MAGSAADPIAPVLWAYEVRNIIPMGLRRKRITPAEAHGLTVYDAAYLDLAIRRGAPIASLDVAVQRAAVKAGVELFAVEPGN